MNTIINQQATEVNAPACFGAVSCFSCDSDACKRCPSFTECTAKVTETLSRISSVVDVSDYMKRHERAKKIAATKVKTPVTTAIKTMPMPSVKLDRAVEKVTFELTDEQMMMIATLPVKAKPFAENLFKRGDVDAIIQCLKEGKNTIGQTMPRWMSIAVDKLIEGGTTKAKLTEEYMSTLGWKKSSAQSTTSIAFRILAIFRIVIAKGTMMVANPEIFQCNEAS